MRILLILALSATWAKAEPNYLDLPGVMRLAGASHDEIELARVRHTEAISESKLAWQRFWPTLTLSAGYRGHDGNIQDVAGAIFEASKQQYTVGTSILVDWSPGDIYYKALVADQKAIAAEQLTTKAGLDLVYLAISRYYDLLAAEANAAVVDDDLKLTQDYAVQLQGAVEAGTAFRADLLRVKTQISRTKLRVRQAVEARDLAAAALAEALRLPPESELRPAKADLLPVSLMEKLGISSLLALAGSHRPELQVAKAAETATGLETQRIRRAPLLPSVQAGYGVGGLGGGHSGEWGNFDDQQDFFVGFGWKIGPGGLFDRHGKEIAEARQSAATLQTNQVRASIGREVVEAKAKAQSALDQIAITEEAVSAAEEMVKLAQQRQASQLGVVLEYLLAREELTEARQSRIESVTRYNQAQHALRHAVGHPGETSTQSPPDQAPTAP